MKGVPGVCTGKCVEELEGIAVDEGRTDAGVVE